MSIAEIERRYIFKVNYAFSVGALNAQDAHILKDLYRIIVCRLKLDRYTRGLIALNLSFVSINAGTASAEGSWWHLFLAFATSGSIALWAAWRTYRDTQDDIAWFKKFDLSIDKLLEQLK